MPWFTLLPRLRQLVLRESCVLGRHQDLVANHPPRRSWSSQQGCLSRSIRGSYFQSWGPSQGLIIINNFLADLVFLSGQHSGYYPSPASEASLEPLPLLLAALEWPPCPRRCTHHQGSLLLFFSHSFGDTAVSKLLCGITSGADVGGHFIIRFNGHD